LDSEGLFFCWFPIGFFNLIATTHGETWAMHNHGIKSSFAYHMATGTQQGCPLASIIFLLVFDPTLRMLLSELRKGGCLFACADDVFVVLKHISELAGVQLAFSVLQAASGLTLSPHKCEIVPLWEALSDSTKATLRPLVARFCPLLASSPVVSHLIFLGVPVGPAVTAEMAWDPVILKMANRVRSIAASGTNVSVNCALFVKRVIPILSYISQFFPPTPGCQPSRQLGSVGSGGPQEFGCRGQCWLT